MEGQWTGTYTSEFSGQLLVDIDKVEGQYSGYGIARANEARAPMIFVRFTVPIAQSFNVTVPVLLIDPRTHDIVTWDKVQTLYPGITVADSLSIRANLTNNVLSINWNAPSGQFSGRAALPRTRAGTPSQLNRSNISSWTEFKEYISSLDHGRFIFRGQADNRWRLRTSFHRTGRANLERYSQHDLIIVSRALSGQTSLAIDNFNPNPLRYGAFLSLIQHHGFPTPLLDWTYSPYVASFFAYHRITNRSASTGSGKNRIRVFQFDRQEWVRVPQLLKLSPLPAHFSLLDALATENPRLMPQQGTATYTNVDDIETYIADIERLSSKRFLKVIDLPASERPKVMKELSLMGVTAASLFPGLDGACEELKERFFQA